MKFNKWTMGLAAVGVVSLASAARADEMKMSQVQTALSNTTLSGYVDTSAMWQLGSQNPQYSDGYANIPHYTPGGVQSDGFNLNAIDIALDKPMDESPWAAGYHVELMTGPDAVPYGYTDAVSIRQAYLALRTPIANSSIDWKIGVWDTIIGYESSSDPLNPNYTRSYGYMLEPTTHTGILGTYKINDMFTVSAGIADSSTVASPYGYDTYGPDPINGRNVQETKKAYMAAVAFTAPDSWGWAKGATLNAGIINNDDGAHNGSSSDWGSTSIYAGGVVPMPVTGLKVGAAFDYRDLHNAHGFGAGNTDSSIWNVGLYASYQCNDKLTFNVRGEHMEPNVNGNKYFNPTPSLDEFTATASYQLWANVLSRVEFRWDHVEHGKAFDTTYDADGDPVHANAYLLALNLIYQF